MCHAPSHTIITLCTVQKPSHQLTAATHYDVLQVECMSLHLTTKTGVAHVLPYNWRDTRFQGYTHLQSFINAWVMMIYISIYCVRYSMQSGFACGRRHNAFLMC